MTFLGFQFSIFYLVLQGLLFVAFAVQLYYFIRYFWGIKRYHRKVERGDVEFRTDRPPVTVVIAARDEEENLRSFLPFILEQDYPKYEVIVVNDGSTDSTEDYLSLMSKQNEHLRSTFVPTGTRSISTKKLSITLGIKAAKYDYILLTDADCMPEGNDWISSMMRNFTDETEFVLGYGGYMEKKGFLNKLIKYDTLFVAIQYLGMAAARKPYMGVGRNLAYRKQTFFDMKGFAGNLHLKSGDDDLLVNRGANEQNTRIEVAPESVTWSEPKKSFKGWYGQKERHLSVSTEYSGDSKRRLSVEPFTRGLFYASFLAIAVLAVLSLNWLLLGAALLLFITRHALLLTLVNKSAKVLGERKFYFGVLFFDIFLPLLSLHLLLFGRKNKNIRWK